MTNDHDRESGSLNPQRLCQIWDEHHARLLLIARAIGGPVAESSAEDAVQEAFIELASQSEPPRDVVAWMVRVIRNRLLSWQRSSQRRKRRETAHQSPVQLDTWFASNDSHAVVDRCELTAALRALDETDRQIIVMHHWGEMTFAQIADTLETSRSTVHRRYQIVLRKLQQHLTAGSPHVP